MSVFPRGRATACFLLVLLGVLSCLHTAASRPVPSAGQHRPPDGVSWRSFEHLHGARRGSHVAGLADLKRYLARFGYMQPRPAHQHDDVFDEHMEAAVRRYQSSLSLPVTGRLDASTLGRIMTKRCGVADGAGAGAGMSVSLSASATAAAGAGSRFTFLDVDQQPPWTRSIPHPRVLTYAVSPTATVGYLSPEAVRAAFRSAFARWATVIPVEFVETDYDHGKPDIMVGFYEGDHGDGSPFDGRYGELAHAYTLEDDGHVHFDAAERWSVDVGSDTDTGDSAVMDLETVAIHEIGHILGLGHSSSPEAIMYPYIDAMRRKVELSADDINGVLLLYGSNPRFRHEEHLEHPAPPRNVPSVSPRRSSWHVGSLSLVCTVLVMLVTLVK